MILVKSTHLTTRITICNYCKYQDNNNINGQQLTQQGGHQHGHQRDNTLPTNNNVNNDNNVNKEKWLFSDFYKKYPVKKSKAVAEKKWKSLGSEKRRLAIEGIEKYIATVPEGISLAHPSTYLNQERWTDEASPTQRTNEPVSAARLNRK